MFIFGSKSYKNLKKTIAAKSSDELKEAFCIIERLKNDHFIACLIYYEAYAAFLNKNYSSREPFAFFFFYEKEETFEPVCSSRNFLLKLKPQINYKEYKEAIEEIKNEIKEGNTYQVNFTTENRISFEQDGYELYKSLLKNQNTSYCAYIKNSYCEILSFSPELFFKKEGEIITAKPMKGTLKRGINQAEDIKNINFLKNDAKNKAENIMIADLLRNDLGKISLFNTVSVHKLLKIETHNTLHQMTSEISSRLRSSSTLYSIFEAIFPCGSITGAPKLSTIDIINRLEKGKREIYCGAIGIIRKENACFSVAIRTLFRKNQKSDFSFRTGGGIVWDSNAKDEWKEKIVKGSFLNSSFELFETLRAKNGEFLYFDFHIKRLKESAQKLSFLYNEKIEAIKPDKDCIYKIILSACGNYRIETRGYIEAQTNKVIIAKKPIESTNPFLHYKSTNREHYKEAPEIIKRERLYDMIFYNEKGEFTEGSYTNIIVKKNCKLYTPPLECGLLDGVLRKKLLIEGKIFEKKLYLEDIKSADKIYLINSVRGIKEVIVKFF